MKNLITENTTVQVHFDSLTFPEKMTFATYINGKFIVLLDCSADMNALEEIKELSFSELQESEEEPVFKYFYEVINSDFGTPFTNSDIPKHFFNLGIL